MIMGANLIILLHIAAFYCFGCIGQMADFRQHPNWHLIDHEACGESMADRIIGGRNASLGQFPWIARIGYSIAFRYHDFQFRCAGTVINKMYVLTAAHCVSQLPEGFIVAVVRLGENHALTSIDCFDSICAEPVQDFSPAKIIVHDRYGKPAFKNDIALIRLDRPATFNGWVEPICLPVGILTRKDYTGESADVAGWGVYDIELQKSSSSLLYVKLPIVQLPHCARSFKKFAQIGPEQLCVGGVEGEDSCAGDSGGPLMKPEAIDGPPKYYIVGLVSFGAKKCGSPGTPAVYTKIAYYLDWILDQMRP